MDILTCFQKVYFKEYLRMILKNIFKNDFKEYLRMILKNI